MKRKRSIESTNDSIAMALSDTLLGTVGIGTITGAALMLNQGKPPTTIDPPSDLSAIIAEVTADMAENATLVADLEGQLSESRTEVLAAKQSTRNTATYYEEELQKSEAASEANSDRWQQAESKAREEANKLARYRKSKRVRVVIVLDTSASMGEGIDESRETLGMLTETMPYALTSFEVGVVCHRKGAVEQQKLTKIVRRKDDNGTSVDAIDGFLEQFVPTGGETRISAAIDLALQDFGQGDGEQSDVLIVCADVGPGDLSGLNNVQAGAITTKLRSWANRPGHNRAVLSIYTPPHPDTTPPDEASHRAFFEALGMVNQRSRFSTRLAAMFPLTFQSSFVQED